MTNKLTIEIAYHRDAFAGRKNTVCVATLKRDDGSLLFERQYASMPYSEPLEIATDFIRVCRSEGPIF